MNYVPRLSTRRPAFTAAWIMALVAGCSSKPAGISIPGVNAADAAAKALELYDANKDGSLGPDEIEKCPPLKAALGSFDENGDGNIAASEIETRLGSLCGPTSAFITFSCAVSANGQPLEGAQVTLRPVDFIGDELPTAKGVTDAGGTARPTVGAELLPPQLANESLVFPGLYSVEITHPQTTIPAEYNSATTLGCEVDAGAHAVTSARFDIKASR